MLHLGSGVFMRGGKFPSPGINDLPNKNRNCDFILLFDYI